MIIWYEIGHDYEIHDDNVYSVVCCKICKVPRLSRISQKLDRYCSGEKFIPIVLKFGFFSRHYVFILFLFLLGLCNKSNFIPYELCFFVMSIPSPRGLKGTLHFRYNSVWNDGPGPSKKLTRPSKKRTESNFFHDFQGVGAGGPNRIFPLNSLLRGVQFIISDRVLPEV